MHQESGQEPFERAQSDLREIDTEVQPEYYQQQEGGHANTPPMNKAKASHSLYNNSAGYIFLKKGSYVTPNSPMKQDGRISYPFSKGMASPSTNYSTNKSMRFSIPEEGAKTTSRKKSKRKSSTSSLATQLGQAYKKVQEQSRHDVLWERLSLNTRIMDSKPFQSGFRNKSNLMEAIVKQVELDLTSRKPPKAPNGNGFTEIPKGKSYRDQKGYVKMNVSHIPNLHMSVKFLDKDIPQEKDWKPQSKGAHALKHALFRTSDVFDEKSEPVRVRHFECRDSQMKNDSKIVRSNSETRNVLAEFSAHREVQRHAHRGLSTSVVVNQRNKEFFAGKVY